MMSIKSSKKNLFPLFLSLGIWILATVIVIAVVAVIGAQCASAKTILKFSHVNHQTHPKGIAADRFAELVDKYTNGQINVQVFHAGQLGDLQKAFGSTKLGAIEMSISPYSLLADIVPDLQVYQAGYFFNTYDEVKKVLEHPELGQKWNEKLIEKGGLRVLGSYYFGARNLTTTKLLVKSTTDLKGRKIRCVPHEMSLAVIIGLGGNPTPVNFAELFTALRPRNRRWSGESALHHLVTEILRSTEVSYDHPTSGASRTLCDQRESMAKTEP